MEIDKAACTKCLNEWPHPWCDSGEPHFDARYEPGGEYAPPRHLPEEDDEQASG